MTRGKIVIFTDKGIKSTCEFNGDMYLPSGNWRGHGLLVFSALEEIEKEEDYDKFTEWFNDVDFKYGPKYGEDYTMMFDIPKSNKDYASMLNFSEDYFKYWFSDYIYIKNISKENVTITCEEEDSEQEERTVKKIVEPGEVIVLNFGRLVNYNKEFANYFKEQSNKVEE